MEVQGEAVSKVFFSWTKLHFYSSMPSASLPSLLFHFSTGVGPWPVGPRNCCPPNPSSESEVGDFGSALITKVRGFGFELEGNVRELGNCSEEMKWPPWEATH